MKTNLTLLLLLFSTATFAQTIRRVNNNPGVTGTNIYATIQAAHDAAVSGDIVYVEPSINPYGTLRCIKSLKIYGNGYFLGDNPGLQAVTLSSTIGILEIHTAAASGTEVYGLTINGSTYIIASNNVKIKRCNMGTAYVYNGGTSNLGGGTVPDANVSTFEFSQNICNQYFISPSTGFSISNGLMENNLASSIYASSSTSSNISNMIVKNNTIVGGSGITILNTVFENNILVGITSVAATSCTINNNVASGNVLPAGSGNQNSFLNLDLEFIGTGSDDKKKQLKSGSPLLTAGNGGTQVGMYGGTNPYVISGIPAVPNFTKILSTGTGSSTSPLSITISTKSNN